MKNKLILLLSLSVYICYGQKKIDTKHYNDLLNAGKYAIVLKEALKEREQPYGKDKLIDYFIARAYCGTNHVDIGNIWYSSILKNHKGLSEAFTKIVTEDMRSCQAEANAGKPVALRSNLRSSNSPGTVNSEGPSAGVSGKMGAVYRPCETAPRPVKILRDVSNEEMESRLFTKDQAQEAKLKYQSILNPNYHVNVNGRFIIITYGATNLNDQGVIQVSKKLEMAYQYFTSHFGLRPPDKLLAVYLLPQREDGFDGSSTNMLQQTAELVHGIEIPDENIGYSNVKDLSLLGISSQNRIGTLYHELMHLMIRTDIGDVPPWMDEGIACVYETSVWNGSKLSGMVNNWRSSVLEEETRKKESKIPRLRDFLNYSWSKFDGVDDSDICIAALNYAYAKHLMLFLQETNQLQNIFTAFKNRATISADSTVTLKSDIQVFEETFGASVENTEKQFDSWIKNNYGFSLYERDPVVESETFLEVWHTHSQGANNLFEFTQNKSEKKSWQNIINKLAKLKTRYDAALPQEPENNSVQQQTQQIEQVQQMPLSFDNNSLNEDHYTIAKREKNMRGIDGLKKELKEIVKQYDLLIKKN